MSEAKPTFIIKIIDDESENFYIGDTYITSANHDDHGWAGMESLEVMFKKIADTLGYNFNSIDIYGNEDE
jgi:hypothetical protein